MTKPDECVCLACAMRVAIDAWHEHNGFVREGHIIYQAAGLIKALVELAGEVVAQAERIDARAAERMLEALLRGIPERAATYGQSLAKKQGGLHAN